MVGMVGAPQLCLSAVEEYYERGRNVATTTVISPGILNLIEQLRDLKESEGKASKAQ